MWWRRKPDWSDSRARWRTTSPPTASPSIASSPGLIDTARAPGAPEPAHHAIHRTLTGKRGTPEEVATVVRFLCGPGARYVTGQTVHANGGAYLGS